MVMTMSATSTYDYQQHHRFFAQIPMGMEDLGMEELLELKAERPKPAYGGVYFEADWPTLCRVNYMSRCLTRVLAPLTSFRCHSHEYLYRRARGIHWADFFTADHTFAVFTHLSNSRISHSQYAGLRVKDAIVDYFREQGELRPSVSRSDPDVWINLHVENNMATINLDTSGGSLHRRGYREKTVEATMQETLAAAVIRLASWDGSSPLYDPMCGSGTLLAEALMSYCHIPSAFLRRRFGFEFLPDFDSALWKPLKEDADRHIREIPEGLIAGSDISRKAVEAAKTNTLRLPQGEKITLQVIDFRSITKLENASIVCNPPYGIRLHADKDLGQFYQAFGDFLKQRCKGSEAFIYFGNREMISQIGLKPSWKKPLSAGGLDGRLVKFELY
jgi:putative N6-adenine-specific DNA methylase